MARTKGAKNKPKKIGKKKAAKAVRKPVKKKAVKKKSPAKKVRRKAKSPSDLSTFLIADNKGNTFRSDDTFEPGDGDSTEVEFDTRAEAKAFLKQAHKDYANQILPANIGESLQSAEVKPKKDLYAATYQITDSGNVLSMLHKLPLPNNAKAVSLKEAVKNHEIKLKRIIASRKQEVKDTVFSVKEVEKQLAKFQKNMKAFKA